VINILNWYARLTTKSIDSDLRIVTDRIMAPASPQFHFSCSSKNPVDQMPCTGQAFQVGADTARSEICRKRADIVLKVYEKYYY
jgi:hypothetical protein